MYPAGLLCVSAGTGTFISHRHCSDNPRGARDMDTLQRQLGRDGPLPGIRLGRRQRAPSSLSDWRSWWLVRAVCVWAAGRLATPFERWDF